MNVLDKKKYFHNKLQIVKFLKIDDKKQEKYKFLSRIIFCLMIFSILAFLITVFLQEPEVLQKNYQNKYHSAQSERSCCRTCAFSKASSTSETCYSAMEWPVKPPRIVKAFNPPPKPWLAGHRGVDLAAPTGTPLFAPADGVISFAGKVARKSVVTIRHGELTSTFEPAVTKLAVGVKVKRGQRFAHIEGGSDHCKKYCVQWGLKRKNRTYVNPAGMTVKRRIVLKPVE